MTGPREGYYNGPPGLHGYEEYKHSAHVKKGAHIHFNSRLFLQYNLCKAAFQEIKFLQ